MKKRIYTDKEAALGFNSKILTFNDEALTFWVKGLTHFDVNAFTYNEVEMGEAKITCDILVGYDTIPAFDRFWYVDFRGERYYLSTLTPACVKDTSSLRYKYSLTFKSQRADLERYEFANIVSVASAPQVVSYDFTLPLTIQGFVERMNINLDYYFGSGVWQMVLDSSYMNNLNTLIYDGTSTVTVSFSRETLWSLLTGLYDIYGLRWKISNEGGIMTIRLGYTPITLSHTFEYGKDKGLISIERVNAQPNIYTRLTGFGSDKNLPYRYFDSSTSQFQEDPDHNEYTENITYKALRTASYRQYVKGWNDASIGAAQDSSTYAYLLGYNDASIGNNFNPVDYVISPEAEAIYGIRKGSIENNEDIYPTFQDVSTAEIGYLDEVIAVETVYNDDYTGIDGSLNQVVADAMSRSNYNGSSWAGREWVMTSAEFETTADFDNISFIVTFDVSSGAPYGHSCTVQLMSGETVIDASSFSVTDCSTYFLQNNFAFKGLAPANYKVKVSGSFDMSIRSVCTQSVSNIIRHPKYEYKETFDIWIKNIWGSSQDIGESDDTYMHGVWDDLVSPQGDMTVMFSSGMMAGDDYEFVIAKQGDTNNYFIYHDETKSFGGVPSHWRLRLIKSEANLESTGLPLPNMVINASAGDRFFLTNIEMPYHPYVYDAENRLETYITNELAKTNNENPTYTIAPSAEFLETYAENASIGLGVMVPFTDTHIFGSGSVALSITSLTIEYMEGKILPKWNITIAEKPTAAKNAVQVLQGDVKVLSSNLLSASQLTEQVQMALDNRYLQKGGTEQVSYSKTTFKDAVFLDGVTRSTDYLQGQMGGYGFAIYKDATDNYVMEIDKLNVRKVLNINELVINQVSIYGGIHIYSAAAMTVSAVDSSNADYHVCYLDIKNGTVLNQFVTGDHAYCQRYDPESNTLVKYYWKEVVDVGSDYIAISKTGGDGSVNEVPSVGDNIAQLGNNTNVSRQSALIIDQTNGGTVTQYAKISGYTLIDKEYIRYGVDPLTGRAYERIYGDFYAGGRNQATDNYISFDSSTGVIAFRGTIRQESAVVDSGGNEGNLTVDRGNYDGGAVYYPGNTVYYLGSTYTCDVQTTAGIVPTNTDYWHVSAQQGADGATLYTWIKYADTSVGGGLSDNPTNKLYIGFAYNKYTATESETQSDYSWSLIKGDQGVQGPQGADGVTTYTWIKYSDYPDGTGLYDTPNASTGYIGIAVNKTTSTESTTKTDYTWSKFKGDQGVQGDQGVAGGNTAIVYLYKRAASAQELDFTNTVTYSFTAKTITSGSTGSWSQTIPSGSDPLYVVAATAYSNTDTDTIAYTEWSDPVVLSTNGTNGLNSATVTLYKRPTGSNAAPSGNLTYTFSTGVLSGDLEGWSQDVPASNGLLCFMVRATAVADTDTDVITPSEWSVPIVPFLDGVDGVTTYTWIKYADTSIGGGLSDDPTGKEYIGLAYNKTTAVESTTPGDYTWSKFKGEQGVSTVAIYCDSLSLSVTPSVNAFTKAITIRLLSGATPIPVANWTSKTKTLTGLTAGSDSSTTNDWIINLTAFSGDTVSVGYVNVSIVFGGQTYALSISVGRIFNAAMINGKVWVSGASYTGSCIQRSVVKYSTLWYIAKITAGTFSSSTNPSLDTTHWQLLNNYTNVATDSLFADEANIAGFIYKDEQMVSQSGTIGGDASTNWAHPDFVPNLTLDGSTGEIVANKAIVRGTADISSGSIGGFLISNSSISSSGAEMIFNAIDGDSYNSYGSTAENVNISINGNPNFFTEQSYTFNVSKNRKSIIQSISDWRKMIISNWYDLLFKSPSSDTSYGRYGYQYAGIGSGHMILDGIIDGAAFDKINLFTANYQIVSLRIPIHSNRITVSSAYTGCVIVLPDLLTMKSALGIGTMASRRNAFTFRIDICNVGSNDVNIAGKNTIDIGGTQYFNNSNFPLFYEYGTLKTAGSDVSLFAHRMKSIMLIWDGTTYTAMNMQHEM